MNWIEKITAVIYVASLLFLTCLMTLTGLSVIPQSYICWESFSAIVVISGLLIWRLFGKATNLSNLKTRCLFLLVYLSFSFTFCKAYAEHLVPWYLGTLALGVLYGAFNLQVSNNHRIGYLKFLIQFFVLQVGIEPSYMVLTIESLHYDSALMTVDGVRTLSEFVHVFVHYLVFPSLMYWLVGKFLRKRTMGSDNAVR